MKKKDVCVVYDITYKCNVHCDYCTMHNFLKTPYEPSIYDIDKMFRNLSHYNISQFVLFGGEPTLSKNIFYTIDALLSNNDVKQIDVCTNGLRGDVIQKLYEMYGTVIYPYVSFHPSTYSSQLLKSYEYIISKFSEYKINIVLDKRNEENLIKFSSFLKQYNNVDYWLCFVKQPTMKGDKKTPFYVNDYSDLKFLNRMCKHYNKSISELINRCNTPKKYFNKICKNNVIQIRSDGNIDCDNYICFQNKCNINIYFSKYYHSFDTKICDIIKPDNLGYCYWCDHE